jgi:sugar O-acyltransferase (sialic acid O-acetyltransferase NeuD family)
VSQTPPTADATPSDCERIIIVGAGGFGREVLQWARHAWPEHVHKLTGFVSADPTKLHGHAPSLPIIGLPNDFELRPTDGFVLGIGIPRIRRVVAEQLEARGARFLTLIHPTAIVADTAVIGPGSVICPYAIVSDAVRLGRCVLVNYHASLGHDAEAGDYAVLSPYSSLGGSACVEEDTFLGLHASVAPGKRLAARSAISANSTALSDVPEECLVYGVPGRIAPKLEVSAK